MISAIRKWATYCESNKGKIFPYILLAALGFAFFQPVVRFPPVDFDDLLLLSSVKHTPNPLTYLIGDWGFGNHAYRPLHSISLWVVYQVVGVSSGPNQLINILLHISAVLLLYALLRRLSIGWITAFIMSGLAMFSMYTTSPAVWVSDRPTLFSAIFVLILLNYLASLNELEPPNPVMLFILSMLGLMSKESGLIIPMTALFYLVVTRPLKNKKKFQLAGPLIGLIAAYFVFRMVVFGSQSIYYDESGYLLGSRYYENLQALTEIEKYAAMGENVIKHVLAIFLPIFDSLGKFSLLGTVSNTVITMGATISITALAFQKKISKFQIIALIMIVLNGLIHYQVFRYRTLYISQFALCILVAVWLNQLERSSLRKNMALAISIGFIFWNMWGIGENLTFSFIAKQKTINSPDFVASMSASAQKMDKGILEEVVRKYRH